MIMRIDAHQHFWLMERRQGQWPPAALAAIHRDFLPPDLESILKRAGVGGTVLVQSLPELDDTQFLLELAAENPFALGVVGWVDMKQADAPKQIAALAGHRKFKGIRPMLQDIADVDWIDDPALEPAVSALIAHRLTFDALVLPRHLPALTRFIERCPALPVVIDHGAKPLIADGRFVDWRKRMKALAGFENVCCKLSGLLVEAGDQRPEAVRPYAETILELFGETRTIWGSDWPVVNLVSDYQAWLDQCLDIVPAAHHDAVFGGNAARFYHLDSGQ
jgi:L-fuconolactonase